MSQRITLTPLGLTALVGLAIVPGVVDPSADAGAVSFPDHRFVPDR